MPETKNNEDRENSSPVIGILGQVSKNLNYLNPQTAPVAQHIAEKVLFRRFRGKGVEFF